MEGGHEISFFSLLLQIQEEKMDFLSIFFFFFSRFVFIYFFYICPVMISAGREEERCSVGPAVISVCFTILR